MPFRWQGPPPMMGGEGELIQLKIYHYRKEEQQFHQISSKDRHDRENSCAKKEFFVFFSACIMMYIHPRQPHDRSTTLGKKQNKCV